MPATVEITVADLPPLRECSEFYEYRVETIRGGTYPTDSLQHAAYLWVEHGIDSDLHAVAVKQDGDEEIQYVTHWRGGVWTDWKAE